LFSGWHMVLPHRFDTLIDLGVFPSYIGDVISLKLEFLLMSKWQFQSDHMREMREGRVHRGVSKRRWQLYCHFSRHEKSSVTLVCRKGEDEFKCTTPDNDCGKISIHQQVKLKALTSSVIRFLSHPSWYRRRLGSLTSRVSHLWAAGTLWFDPQRKKPQLYQLFCL